MIFLFLALSLARAPLQAPAPIPAGHARVIGQFVDEGGVAVPNVRVDLDFYPHELVTECDGDGRFTADIPCDRESGALWLSGEARAFGYAVDRFSAEIPQGREHDFGRIALAPGGVVAGRVVDADQRPLSGARVVAYDRPEFAPQGSHLCERPDGKWLADALTNADGAYEMVGVPVGRAYLWIQHESAWAKWLPESVDVHVREEVRVDDVVLVARPEEYRIEGVVVDERGAPIAGVEVSTDRFFPESSGCMMSSLDARAISDVDGCFVLHLRQVFDGGHDLHVLPPGDVYDTQYVEGVLAGTRGLVVRLATLRSFELAVVNTEGGPVESFGWHIESDSTWPPDGEVEPHAGGRATIRVADVAFELAVSAPCYERKEVGRFEPGELPAVVEVILERKPTISGVVTFEGRLVAGAVVEVVKEESSPLFGLIHDHTTGLFRAYGDPVVTDELGRFELPRRGTHSVRARAAGYAAFVSEPVSKEHSAGLILELGRGGSVVGSVQPPVTRSSGPLYVEFHRERVDGKLVSIEAPQIRVDEHGAFRLDHAEPGPWLMALVPSSALVSDLRWDVQQVRELRDVPWVVNVKEDESTQVDIDLLHAGICRLSGRLSGGDELRRGSVQLLLEGPMALEIANARLVDGRFEIAARSPGTYRLLISTGPRGRHEITDLVELALGPNSWSHDFPAESWRKGDVRLDH